MTNLLVQYLVSDVISDVHISARKSILSSFTIGGGTSMLKGFPDRLKFELNFLNEGILFLDEMFVFPYLLLRNFL